MAASPEPSGSHRDRRTARDAGRRGAGDAVPPMIPSRWAFLLAFGAVVVAGILGGIIGFGIADVGSGTSTARFVGALLGAVIGATGVGIVAVLVLRAMAEWNRQHR